MQIPSNTLKCVLQFAAKKDIRYYLQGVCFEQCATGTYAVATDGHVVCVARLDSETHEPLSIIISSDHLAQAVKNNKCDVFIEPSDGKVTLKSSNGDITVPLIDGRFPDWRRVTRAPITGEIAYIDPALLDRINTAGQLYSKRKVAYITRQNGNSIGHCFIDNELQAFVMPTRWKDDDMLPVPSWIATA